MAVYMVNVFFTLMLGSRAAIWIKGNENNKEHLCPSLVVLTVLWVIVYTFRGMSVGADTTGYYFYYNWIQNRAMTLQQNIAYQRDIGFAFVQYICSKVSGGNWLFFNCVFALLTYIPVVSVVKKHSHNVTMSLLLYVFLLLFHAGLNGMRQMVAVGICFYAYYEALLCDKWIKYAVLMLVAYSFHSSVVLVLPFFLISKLGFKSVWMAIVSLGLIVSFFILSTLWEPMINFLRNIGQEKLAEDYEIMSNAGSSLLRAIVGFAPVLLAYPKRDVIARKYEAGGKEYVLVVFSALFTVLSMRFWIFSRVAIYMSMMLIMFIPKLEVVFREDGRRIGMYIVSALYFLYMIFLLLHGDGNYYPYTFISLN